MVLIKSKRTNTHKQLFNSQLLSPATALYSVSIEGSFDPSPACFPDFVWKLKSELLALIPLLVLCVADHISLPPPPRFN